MKEYFVAFNSCTLVSNVIETVGITAASGLLSLFTNLMDTIAAIIWHLTNSWNQHAHFNGKGVAMIFIAEPAVIRQWLLDFLSELHSCSLGWFLLLLITSGVNFLVSPCGLGAAEYSFDTIRTYYNCYMWSMQNCTLYVVCW